MSTPGLTVESIMSRSLVTAGPDDTLWAARQLMLDRGIHHLPVLERHRLVGIVSDRDLLRHISPFVGLPSERALDAASLHKRLHQVMTRQVVTSAMSEGVSAACEKMLSRGISCLPVVDAEGRLRGIVTDHDVLRWLSREAVCRPREGGGSAAA